ncbi:DUF4189 domain-containing protein [Variovorax sp. J22R133]|uniref:DUF4189 domain-containing protein n=1 Tax=Variovorax brevis TaxID=3053503 RepID=UPI0025761084|nr:DUF4189 domain-containing protein [Variovorax sp. J22R133]MDM0111504.1 DUF4189 domain-containing protein [Variovorax sp. J22R133]
MILPSPACIAPSTLIGRAVDHGFDLPPRAWRMIAALVLWLCFDVAGLTANAARADTGQKPSWGAIASVGNAYGYSFNHPSRRAAELAASAQCDRAAGSPGACVVRAYFDRYCGALAIGNFSEWGSAIAPTAGAAAKEAAAQCNSHLPTEPCKVLVSVCSPR